MVSHLRKSSNLGNKAISGAFSLKGLITTDQINPTSNL